jgi:hypothetical protein
MSFMDPSSLCGVGGGRLESFKTLSICRDNRKDRHLVYHLFSCKLIIRQ